MNLGERLKKNRKQCGFSQEEVAAKINITRQTLSNWEHNRSEPDIRTLMQLSGIYQVSLEKLVRPNEERADMDMLPDEKSHISSEQEEYHIERILFYIISMIVTCVHSPIGVVFNLFMLLFYKTANKKEWLIIKIIALICLIYSIGRVYKIGMLMFHLVPGYCTIEKL